MKQFLPFGHDRSVSLAFVFPISGVFLCHATDVCVRDHVSSFVFFVYPLISLLFASSVEVPLYLLASRMQQIEALEFLLKWLSAFPTVGLRLWRVKDCQLDDASLDVLKKGMGYPLVERDLNDIEIYEVICDTPPIPSEFKTYSMGIGGKSIILFRDSIKDMSSFSRFTLYHEIGHAYPTTPAFSTIKSATWYSLVSLVLVSALISQSIVLTVTCLLIYWAARANYNKRQIGYLLSELSADQFAAASLIKNVSLDKIARQLQKFTPNAFGVNERADQLISFAKNPNLLSKPDLPTVPWIGAFIAFGAIYALGLKWNTNHDRWLLTVLPILSGTLYAVRAYLYQKYQMLYIRASCQLTSRCIHTL